MRKLSLPWWFLSVVAVTALRTKHRRKLLPGDFVPLSCNTSPSPCQPWSIRFGATDTVYSSRIIIECGECVTMDHPASAIELQDGIDIRGKLEFPDNYSIEITTTMVVVQGQLDMFATKPVDGVPSIRFNFVGADDSTSFEAVEENAGVCANCFTGRRAFVVAGGTLNLHGLPSDTPTWLPLHDVSGGSNPQSIIVADTVYGKWGIGAELLVASHTRRWNDQQVRTITGVSPALEHSGYVEIQLNSTILRPTTFTEYPDFAVEIALLSRNILLDGGAADALGGHFEIRQTPLVAQVIEGVEISSFGQPGILGRYPIHFHLCADATGTIVSKNSIRQSKQRCIVLHGTDNVIVSENIAFDTRGHCFLTEDGIEMGNKFIRNLGAKTSNQVTLIPGESDDEAATFWITSVLNRFVGNIAAGSQNSGYWIAPHKRGPRAYLYPNLSPMNELLTEFRDNIAHSCDGNLGAFRTYKPGYLPTAPVTLSGIRAFRNSAGGLVMHKVHNVIVSASLFADNDVGIDIDRADGITVEDTVIMGESDSFKELQSRQNTEPVCRSNRVLGIDLHTWKPDREFGGATIRNVTFSGFTNTVCANPSAIWFDKFSLRQGMFELYTSFEATTVSDGADSIDFCFALQGNPPIDKLYLIDLDGSLSGDTLVTAPATLIGTSAEMTRFVNNTNCSLVPNGCYSYCKDTCFRSIRYELVGDGTENYKLRVCKKGKIENCAKFPGSRRGNENRLFVAHLPTGIGYDAVFLDDSDTEISVLPEYFQYEIDLCSGKTFVVDLFGSISAVPSSIPSPSPVEAPPSASPTPQPVPANPVGSDFVYLSCNAIYGPCESWTAKFGASTVYSTRITIPCGECITMDHSAPAIELQDGLDIHGKLVFPDNYSIDVSVTMIVVQGDLEITSSKPVDGNPAVKFNMVGEDDALFFTPVQENRDLCSPVERCRLFRKGIVVAGGKVTFHGLPANTPSWVQLYDVVGTDPNNPTSIVVADTVHGRWAPGALLFIASHTRVWDGHQVRTIVDVSLGEPGYVKITLDSPILRPTTYKDYPDFAVEVGLLSRNIMFDGGSTDTVGGYLQIRQTSSVIQVIEGVEIVNFGAPGFQGRYPVHVHFCGDAAGTVIARNTIRQSKQRCVVIQGTDNIVVEENVAFETRGHCFMTEDGIEMGNAFIRNLGAYTIDQTTVILGETDGDASTFFIASVLNSFIGNAAAGSQGSGYWFAVHKRGPRASLYPELNPINALLLEFRDNVVHSTGLNAGAVRTFQPGYLPTAPVIISGLKAFRNNNAGLNIYKAQNLIISNSFFADNNVGIDIARSEGITVKDTVIIGESVSYLELAGRQNVQLVCRNNRVVGLELETWKNDLSFGGATFHNVSFSGFADTQCSGPSAIWIDDFVSTVTLARTAYSRFQTLRQGQFDYYTSFEDTTLADGPNSIVFCHAENGGITDAYVIDLDGSLGGGTTVTSPATLIGTSPEMSRFVDTTKCTFISSGCYSYCESTCFRSVRFAVAAAGTENYRLKVCRSGESTGCAAFLGSLRGNEPRNFVAHLPTGFVYTAAFVDENDAEVSPVPTLVSTQYEADLCSEAAFVVDLVDDLSSSPSAIPSLSPSSSPSVSICSNTIVSNSDMENGYNGSWAGDGTLANVAGHNSATAVSYTGELWSINGPSFSGDFLEACLTLGSSWEVSVQVKLNNPWFGDGERCVTNSTCPSLRIVITDSNGNEVVGMQSRDYLSAWNPDGFNELRSALAMPSSGWDGTVGSVSIDFYEYHAENELIVDDFFFSPAQV